MKTVLLEPFCGLGALTQSSFGLQPPCSRQGCKTGYARAVARELGAVHSSITYYLLSDVDPALVNAMRDLFHRPRQLSLEVERLSTVIPQARQCWDVAKQERTLSTAAWWVWCAGAFRGVGGWRGGHKHRPNIDGFSPSRAELAHRIGARPMLRQVDVVCCSADELEPFPGALVYFDPPYQGTSNYEVVRPVDVWNLARLWRENGSKVVVSEGRPLEIPGFRSVRITGERVGNNRKDSNSVEEWLAVSI